MMCSHARLDGYRSAMTSAGLPIREEWVRFGDFHLEGGARHASELLDLDEPPTAIFAGSDLQALGVYDVARLRGIRIPEDLSVVGYDDIPLAEWVSPRLTTVLQPLEEMGREPLGSRSGSRTGRSARRRGSSSRRGSSCASRRRRCPPDPLTVALRAERACSTRHAAHEAQRWGSDQRIENAIVRPGTLAR